jgi:hypothetical protein
MRFHRHLADAQLTTNLLVHQTADDQCYDLALTAAQ